jgi:hypothetical protein
MSRVVNQLKFMGEFVMCTTIKRKCSSMPTATPISICPILSSMLLSMHWKVLDHLPCSPELSACDFHVFDPIKKALKDNTFGSDKNVTVKVVQRFQQQPREFFVKGIHQLLCQWYACLKAHEDHF